MIGDESGLAEVNLKMTSCEQSDRFWDSHPFEWSIGLRLIDQNVNIDISHAFIIS
jgi:hypothetical protein